MRVLEVSDAGMERYYILEQKPFNQLDDEERAFIKAVDYIQEYVSSDLYGVVNITPKLDNSTAREWMEAGYFDKGEI